MTGNERRIEANQELADAADPEAPEAITGLPTRRTQPRHAAIPVEHVLYCLRLQSASSASTDELRRSKTAVWRVIVNINLYTGIVLAVVMPDGDVSAEFGSTKSVVLTTDYCSSVGLCNTMSVYHDCIMIVAVVGYHARSL